VGEASEEKLKKAKSESSKGEGLELVQLAKQQRMNTDLRKNIFCVIMGAEDYMDAFEKLSKLSLSASNGREIVRVLIDCCAQEAKYNPYYAHLAIQLCANDKKMKFTHQLAFWDLFKMIDRDRGQAQARRYTHHCLLSLLLTAVDCHLSA
jgi:hypothetical protein